MGRLLAVYSIILYVYVASALRNSNHTAPKDNPIHKDRLKVVERKDERNDSGGVDDVEPRREWRVLESGARTSLLLCETAFVTPGSDESRLVRAAECSIGDVLTPPELLPLAKKLRDQVDTRKPGEGTGIVSSAPSAEVLADVLFERFFTTGRRIARLNKYDIAGLDALQALALDGNGIHQNLKLVSVDGGRCYVDEFNKNGVVDNRMCYTNGPEPRKSIYMLLTKPAKRDPMHANNIPNNKSNRRKIDGYADKIPQSRIDLMNKLNKKRRLVVNTGRKYINNKHMKKTNVSKNVRQIKGSNIRHNDVSTLRPLTHGTGRTIQTINVATPRTTQATTKANLKGCRWKFECLNPRDLDTCRLKTFCPHKGETGTDTDPKQYKYLQHARRMIGISSVDEEVEKILEARALTLRPSSYKKVDFETGPTEDLSQYFQKLLLRQEFAKKRRQDEKDMIKKWTSSKPSLDQ